MSAIAILIDNGGERLRCGIESPALPERILVPVPVAPHRARWVNDGAPLCEEVSIGARVFSLDRVTAADHLGPTEAEYREVER